MEKCFATTARGLETLLIKELEALGAQNINVVNAGAQFSATFETIMRINLHSRIASRILLQVAHDYYQSEDDIYSLAFSINWPSWFSNQHKIKVSTTAIHCNLKSLEFITLRVKDAICDLFVEKTQTRPDVNKYNPDMRIYNFLTTDTITIYIDTSGEALFKRGYRQSKLEAPLKENLAAGLIQLSGWTPDQPFYDPMCGSGTLAIEAISYGLNLAPGLNREFAFEKFCDYDHQTWIRLKLAAKEAVDYSRPLQIYASDVSQNAISATSSNFKQLQLIKYVKFSLGDILDLPAPANHGVMLTNPPYGVRLDDADELALLYPKLAAKLKSSYAGWNCFFITADLRMPKLMRLKPSRKIPLFNGDLECRLFEFKMVAGSNR